MPVAAEPDRFAVELQASFAQSFRICTFADHRDIRLKAHECIELAMQGHVAVPSDDAHGCEGRVAACVVADSN